MNISDKLVAVHNSFTVTMHDNGFVFSTSGRKADESWGDINIVCTHTEITSLIREFISLPRAD